MPKIPKALLKEISKVTNKRARFVLDAIVKNGLVTTEQISDAGYEHPPRAARDVRELGFPLTTVKVKHTNGRTIAAYTFSLERKFESDKIGRQVLSKKQRDSLIRAIGGKCQICGAVHNLQIDHRIPYQVAGESQKEEADPYQLLCGACNRKKSWDCEHCLNWTLNKELATCMSCYWAEPSRYTHVAMEEQRRVDLVWIKEEIPDFQRIEEQAKIQKISIAKLIKRILCDQPNSVV